MTELPQHDDDHMPALLPLTEGFLASVSRGGNCMREVAEGRSEIAQLDGRVRKIGITIHPVVHRLAPRANVAIGPPTKANYCTDHGIFPL